MLRRIFFAWALLAIFPASGLAVSPAVSVRELPAFHAGDRVLVLAPHPDDETLGAGGVIQRAVGAGARVKVVLMTNGENNRLSFMFYKKRPIFSGKTYLRMGEVRRKETLRALKVYGLEAEDLITLGYPDFGTLKILTRHWEETKPYSSLAAGARQVPEGHFSPGAPYAGTSILRDLSRILLDYRPTKVFVSHPADENRDHRALYLFTRIALWDLEGRIEQPEIYPYLVHFGGWPEPDGHNPELELPVPLELRDTEVPWQALEMTRGELAGKREAVEAYPSQIPYAPEFLPSYVRRNEFFGDYPAILIPASPHADTAWQRAKSYDHSLEPEKIKQEKLVYDLAYARREGKLLIRFKLKKRVNKALGIFCTLLGYRRDVPFAAMPKIELRMRFDGIRVKDRNEAIPEEGVELEIRGKEYELRVPLSLLGDPEFILASAKTRRWLDLAVDETAWRILSLA